MNILRSLFAVACLFGVVTRSASAASYPPMGAYKGSRGGSSAPSYSDYAGLHQFESWFGYQVPRSIDFLSANSWSDFDGAVAWITNPTSGWPSQRWRTTYSTPMLPSDGVSTLAQGATGAYDAHFTRFAQALVGAGEGDAIIRLGWEMNGSWYAWRVLNSADAASYRNYWIRIVTAMRAVPGAAFKFDFCPANGYVSFPSSNSYPGDAYVDIIGLDVYNTSYATTDPAARWNELVTQSYGLQYWADFAATHGKQLSYPEWGTGTRTTDSSGGGDDPFFIQKMFDWITTHNVAYHNYWDYQAPDFHAQLSNGQFPNAAAKFKELFGPTFAGQVAAPDNLAATAGNGRITLTWTPVSGATSYTIQRATTIGHSFTAIDSASIASYTDTGLTNGTTYYYVVTAVGAGGESAFSARVAATPLDALLVDDADATGVAITGTWTSSTSGDNYYGRDYLHDGNTGSAGAKSVRFTPTLPIAGDYQVYARWTAGSNRATNTPIDISSTAGVTHLTVNQQVNGGGWFPLGTFNFETGTTGNLLISNAATNGYVIADAVAFIAANAPQPPSIPTGVTGTAGTNQVSLSWPAVPNSTSYDVKRAVASGGPYSTVFSDLTEANAVDTGLVNGVTYYYTVSAKNLVGRSADSIPVSIAPIGPPAAPSGLTAAAGDARVTLSWTGSSGATSYNVKRSAAAGGPYTTVGMNVTSTSFSDNGLTNQTTYYYVVSAANAYGEGANSAEIAAMPQAQFIVDNADATGVTVTGNWTVSASATTYYGTNYLHDGNTGAAGGKSVRFSPNLPSALTADVYLRWTAGTNRASNVPVDVVSAAGTTTVTANQRNNDGVWVLLGRFNFNAGTAGNVTVRNDGANGFVIADAVKFVVASTITPPPSPAGLTATAGDAQAALSWTAASGAATYNVKRSLASGGPYTTVASGLSSTNYTDTGLTNGTPYFYVVSASNLGGESGNSSPVRVTPSGAAAVTVTYVSSGKTYTVGNALVGKGYTIDRTYTISALSPALNNSTMIRTAYDDKALTTATHLTFTIGQPSTVYVCYDARVTAQPGFLNATWTLTGETFSTTHTLASPFKVFARNFPAGAVTLGGNAQPPAAGSWGATAAHYVVLVVPTAPTAASVTLSGLSQSYDGSPKPVTASTTPAGLDVAFTYNGNAAPPTGAGQYAVVGTITTPGYAGAASGTLTVAKAAATIALSGLTQTFDGTPKSATATTSPAGLIVNLTYDGNSPAPTNAGTYAVTATVNDPNYAGTASGSLTVAPAAASVTLAGLTQTFDGAPKPASVTTNPTGLPVTLTYNDGMSAPINAGSYAVRALVRDPNYTGGATGTLLIAKSTTATITLGALKQTYDGTPRPVSVATVPEGLTVDLAYDGSPVPPVYPGAHAVVATINDANYAGTASDTLAINVAALVRHAPTLNGLVDGSVQVIDPEDLTLNNSAAVSGDLLVSGTPAVQLNGQPTYVGTIDGPGDVSPSDHLLTLNHGAVLRHVVRRIDAVALPVVSAPDVPAGIRSVTLNRAGQSAGDFDTIRDLTVGGDAGSVVVPAGAYGNFIANRGGGFILGVPNATQPAIYHLQNLSLNNGSVLQIAGPVILRLANGAVFNASVGDAAHPEWLAIEIHSGGLTLNGGARLQGFVIAPNGTVTINGNSTLKGGVQSDRLTLNGNSLLDEILP